MKPLKFIVVADPHYFSKRLDAYGTAYKEFMAYEQKCYAETPYINDAVFDYLKTQTEADVILFAGDLSFNGEKLSHEDFSAKLKDLQDSGKDLYVVTAGHDIDEWPFAFDEENGRKGAEGIKFFDLYDYYKDFGYDKAISFYRENLSYVAQIGEGVRLLVLCNDSEESKKTEYSEELMTWAVEQMQKAKEENQVMIAMEHYPLLAGQPILRLIPDARQKKSREVINTLADNGVHICFTGHMHNQSINETVSDNGNKFYDVCTGSIIGCPAYMRICTIEDENTIDIRSIPIPDFEYDTQGKSCKQYMQDQFESMIRTLLNNMQNDPERFLRKLGAGDKKALFKPVQVVGKAVNTWSVGKVSRLLMIKCDKSIKNMPFVDLAMNIVRYAFEGDQPYVAGTPEGDVIIRTFKRFKPIINKISKNMKDSQGEPIDLYDALINTAGNYGISDYNATLKFN